MKYVFLTGTDAYWLPDRCFLSASSPITHWLHWDFKKAVRWHVRNLFEGEGDAIHPVHSTLVWVTVCGFNHSGLGTLNSSRSFQFLLLFVPPSPPPSPRSFYNLLLPGGVRSPYQWDKVLCHTVLHAVVCLPVWNHSPPGVGPASPTVKCILLLGWYVLKHLCFGFVFEDFILCLWPVFLLNPESFESCFTMLFQGWWKVLGQVS